MRRAFTVANGFDVRQPKGQKTGCPERIWTEACLDIFKKFWSENPQPSTWHRNSGPTGFVKCRCRKCFLNDSRDRKFTPHSGQLITRALCTFTCRKHSSTSLNDTSHAGHFIWGIFTLKITDFISNSTLLNFPSFEQDGYHTTVHAAKQSGTFSLKRVECCVVWCKIARLAWILNKVECSSYVH